MNEFLSKLKKKEDLSFEESKKSFEIIMDGKASEDEIYSFLTLLSNKGEVSSEIAGGVFVLRNKSKRVNIKNCSFTNFFSYRTNILHGAMINWCKHKPKIIFIYFIFYFIWFFINFYI